MTIAVHIHFSGIGEDLSRNLQFQCFSILADRYPQHQFIFIFDKPYPAGLISAPNIKVLLLPPEIKNPLLQHYWYNFKIPRVLNKYHANHFVCSGMACSLRTNVPQSIVVNELSFLEKKNLYTARETRYLKRFFKKFIAKASAVAITNQAVRNDLAAMFPEAIDKLQLIGYGVPAVSARLSYEAMQQVKDKYSGGREYFLAFITDATIENAVGLLKAFSVFKKRQLSNMQLILLVSSAQKEGIIKDFGNYKYRDEVKIIIPVNNEQENELVTAAYAAIYLPVINTLEDKGLLALSNGVPLLTGDHDFCKSLYHEAALYSEGDEGNIAQRMMLLYKDENLRNNLLHAGRSIAAAYTWEQTAGKLGQSILDTAAQTA